MGEPTEKDIFEVGATVCEQAYDIFMTCDAEDDFCVQHHGTNVVFGGTNRLILTVRGWKLDESYCNGRFIQKFNEFMKG